MKKATLGKRERERKKVNEKPISLLFDNTRLENENHGPIFYNSTVHTLTH